jgi:hypothetical protein
VRITLRWRGPKGKSSLYSHAVRREGLARDVLRDRGGALADERDGHRMGAHALARDAAGGVGGVEEARGRERVGGARVEADEELHALLKRAATLMVKAGYRSYSVTIKVAGKEKRYGLMESSVYLDMVMKRRNPPQK